MQQQKFGSPSIRRLQETGNRMEESNWIVYLRQIKGEEIRQGLFWDFSL